jgi:hypothetical protein
MGLLTIPSNDKHWMDTFEPTEEDTDSGSGLSDWE